MAVNELEMSGTPGIGLGQIFYGASLLPMFNAPGLPPNGDLLLRKSSYNKVTTGEFLCGLPLPGGRVRRRNRSCHWQASRAERAGEAATDAAQSQQRYSF
jgi:hypothetical protein